MLSAGVVGCLAGEFDHAKVSVLCSVLSVRSPLWQILVELYASLLSALTVVCASIRTRTYCLTPKDELPRSEFLELISCCFSLNSFGGAPNGVAPIGVGVKIT